MIELIGTLAALLGSIMYAPQAWRVIKTHHTKDLSLATQALLLIVSLLWIVYGVGKDSLPLIAVNSVIAILASIILVIKIKQDVIR